ncbi:flagellar hook-associated protein FlgL [Peribacillus asahii]|uniref:flagellar hook-associated protein FlgL n=1 Tax=Peribacillus asahii TaxID=228899 RepID=UPI0038085956
MRVTQSMLSNNMMRNVSNSYERLAKLQNQITTQKKFSKPSDNPVAAMMGMNYRTGLNKIEQYSRNIGEATSWIESTDSALGQATSALQRIRELVVQASNGTYEDNQRESVTTEIEQLKEHLLDIGDTQMGDRYIFNGFKTEQRPSDTLEDGLYYGNEDTEIEENIEIEVFDGIKIPINTSGNRIFQEALKKGGEIDNIIESMRTGSQGEITELIGDVDKILDRVSQVRSEIGARQNRIDFMTDRLGEQEVLSKKILSNNEDIDVEKTITEFITQESVHTASLSVGAKIIQPTLLDFLR